MKYLLIAFAFISLTASAQTALDSSLTLTVTKQTLWQYGYSQISTPNWDSRKLPDEISAALGNTKKISPDSLVVFTFKKGKQLVDFIAFIQAGATGAYGDFYRKIYLGNPATVGYTSLKAQLNALKDLNTQQGRTAAQVKLRVDDYGDKLDNVLADGDNRGIDYIKN